MNYFFKIYHWKDGGIFHDYTNDVVCPIFIEERLDETLDTGEIIMESMPISTKKIFPPKTKFRIERYTKFDFSDEPKVFDMVVEHDDIEEYEDCPDICTHHIYLIEASVIAQGMHTDNVALTYELQDVTLNYKTTRSDDTSISKNLVIANGGYATPVRQTDKLTYISNIGGGGII